LHTETYRKSLAKRTPILAFKTAPLRGGTMASGWKSWTMKKILTLSLLSLLSVVSFAAARSVSGTWQVTADGKSDPNMKLVFTPQGAFRFVGSNYSSSGTYKVDGDTIRLNWTKVDGQAVKSGSMKKTLTVAPDNTFKIDRYTYALRR
jgi:hypothetical protein